MRATLRVENRDECEGWTSRPRHFNLNLNLNPNLNPQPSTSSREAKPRFNPNLNLIPHPSSREAKPRFNLNLNLWREAPPHLASTTVPSEARMRMSPVSGKVSSRVQR